MYFKNNYIIFFFILIFTTLSFNISTNFDNGLIKFIYILKDGEVLNIKEDLFIQNDEKIKSSLPEINSAILRSFETEYITLKDVGKQIDINEIGYLNVVPEKITIVDSMLNEKWHLINGRASGLRKAPPNFFENFTHKLFQSKTARSYLFNYSLNHVANLCSKYPSDFKENLLIEMNDLLLFTNSLPNNIEKINVKVEKNKNNISRFNRFDRDYFETEFIDNLQDYWKGFIYRRHVKDKVPIAEIKTSILNAQKKIKSIDTNELPTAMFEYEINNQLKLYISANNYTIYSIKSQKKIILDKGVFIQKIKYLKGDDGEFYQLIGVKASKKHSDGFGPPSRPTGGMLDKYPFRKEIQYLFDSNLEKIQ
jgi:hypothetical protein